MYPRGLCAWLKHRDGYADPVPTHRELLFIKGDVLKI
jgi:hypothetical protein